MDSWIIKNKIFKFSETLILLDNWFINKIKLSKESLLKINAKVLYLVADSLDLVPIKMRIRKLKRRIRETWGNEHTKLNSKQSYIKAVDALKKIKYVTIKLFQENVFWSSKFFNYKNCCISMNFNKNVWFVNFNGF